VTAPLTPGQLRRFWPANVLLASHTLMSSSIILPALPHMALDLNTTQGMIQPTVTAFLLGNAISQLFAGMLSDRYGRRAVALWGTAVWTTACAAAALAPDIESLLAIRLMQALGGAAGLVVSRAIVRDLFDRQNSARALALLMMANSLVPNIAPLAGGYIDLWFGWRWIFVVCAIIGVCAFVAVFAVFPRLTPSRTEAGNPLASMAADFTALLTNRGFLAFGVSTLILSWGNFAIMVAGPILFIDRFGVPSHQYGLYILVWCAGWILGLIVSSRLIVRFGLERLIDAGMAVSVAGTLWTLGLALGGPTDPRLYALSFALATVGIAWTLPNSNAGAISVAPHIAGAAAGLLGFLQIFGGVAGTVTMFALGGGDALPLGAVLTLSAIAAAAVWFLLRRHAVASGRS
jgi:DHA1 family bicyclomycin/chloramphenicol resistance-like MFS transporter